MFDTKEIRKADIKRYENEYNHSMANPPKSTAKIYLLAGLLAPDKVFLENLRLKLHHLVTYRQYCFFVGKQKDSLALASFGVPKESDCKCFTSLHIFSPSVVFAYFLLSFIFF